MTDARLEAAARRFWGLYNPGAYQWDDPNLQEDVRTSIRACMGQSLKAADACALAQAEGVAKWLAGQAAGWPGAFEQAALLLTTQAAELERLRAGLNDMLAALDYLRIDNSGRYLEYVATEHGSRLRVAGIIEQARALLAQHQPQEAGS